MVKRYTVDYSKMISPSTKVVLFGEDVHTRAKLIHEFVLAMPILKKRGFTHVGLEMLPSKYNEKLKKYVQSGVHATNLYNYLNKFWSSNNGRPNGYIEIIKKARQLKMQLIGLDWHPDDIKKYEVCHDKQASACRAPSHLARNKHMAKQIIAHLGANKKIIAYTHYNHTRTIRPLAQPIPGFDVSGIGIKGLLMQKNLNPLFIKLVGGGRSGRSSSKMINDAIHDNVDNTRFYIRGKGGKSEPDFLVHLKAYRLKEGR